MLVVRLVVKGSTTTAIRQTKTIFYPVSNLQTNLFLHFTFIFLRPLLNEDKNVMSIYFRTNLSQLVIFLSISLLFSVQAIGFNVDIDGVLNDVAYKKVSPLNSAEKIGVLYLVPMKDELYIGAEVEDAKINVANPQQFWQGSGIEIWFDWGNEGNATFDKNDQQFWFVPVKGKGKEGYAGQWHRAQDNLSLIHISEPTRPY